MRLYPLISQENLNQVLSIAPEAIAKGLGKRKSLRPGETNNLALVNHLLIENGWSSLVNKIDGLYWC